MPKLRKEPIYLGIDPGKTGGISLVGGLVRVFKMPETERGIYSLFQEEIAGVCPAFAVIEKVWPRPGNAAGSTFKFGTNFGFLRACLYSSEIPWTEVTPQKWMKEFNLKREKTETDTQWKNRLKGEAERLFPGVKILKQCADSVLIAEYCRRARKRGEL